MAQRRATSPSIYNSLLPAGTTPLLHIPLPAPSTSRRADIPEADMPPRKRLLLTAPIPRVEVGESSATAAARQPGYTMAHRVDHSFVDTVDTRVRDTERRTMSAVEVVNLRVSYQSIPSEDPYEVAARQLLELAPRPSEYVPDPIELEDHISVYIPEPEHPEDLVPTEDEALIKPYITEVASAPTPPLPPQSLLPTLI
ncbi:hypothetical protein Tco_0851893 [Tanacetum coccineum]